jgi:flagellar motility protein MotE (MotC chaperone)
MEIVTADMRQQHEATDQLTKEISLEIRKALLLINEIDSRAGELVQVEQANTKAAEDLKKKQAELDETERKNIEKLATVLDTATAETASGILAKMADEGKMDTAVKVLSRMKDRSVAKVLEAMPDASLAAQLLDRMRTLKRTTP